jgi:hypothetical protein
MQSQNKFIFGKLNQLKQLYVYSKNITQIFNTTKFTFHCFGKTKTRNSILILQKQNFHKTNKTFNNYSYNIIIQKVCYSYCCELQKCFSNNNAIKTNYFNSLNHSNGALNNMKTQPMKLCTNSYSINITETNINANLQTISKSNC